MKDFLRLIWRNPMALTGVIILSIFVLGALAAPLITKHAPDKRTGNPHEYPGFVVKSAQTNPNGWVAQNLADDRRTLIMSKKADHVLGTTRMGRDVWSQVVYGARVSLAVGFGAGLTVCLLATIIGVSAGYFGGRVDDVLTAAMNIMLVIPQYPLLFVVAAFIGEAGPLTITLVIGFMSWAWGDRVVRSQTLALREKEFVQAAEVLVLQGARKALGITEVVVIEISFFDYYENSSSFGQVEELLRPAGLSFFGLIDMKGFVLLHDK